MRKIKGFMLIFSWLVNIAVANEAGLGRMNMSLAYAIMAVVALNSFYILHREPYDTCPECGAHLDPGENCDCGGKK